MLRIEVNDGKTASDLIYALTDIADVYENTKLDDVESAVEYEQVQDSARACRWLVGQLADQLGRRT